MSRGKRSAPDLGLFCLRFLPGFCVWLPQGLPTLPPPVPGSISAGAQHLLSWEWTFQESPLVRIPASSWPCIEPHRQPLGLGRPGPPASLPSSSLPHGYLPAGPHPSPEAWLLSSCILKLPPPKGLRSLPSSPCPSSGGVPRCFHVLRLPPNAEGTYICLPQ